MRESIMWQLSVNDETNDGEMCYIEATLFIHLMSSRLMLLILLNITFRAVWHTYSQ